MCKIKLSAAALSMLILVITLLYCVDVLKIFKSNSQEYVIIQNADTLVYGDIIIRKFNDLKLFKNIYYGKYPNLLNKDTSEIRRFLKSRDSYGEDSSIIIEHYLNEGLRYYSSFADKNYDKLPDTIWATGYEVSLYRFIGKFDPVSVRRIKIMSYKYKK